MVNHAVSTQITNQKLKFCFAQRVKRMHTTRHIGLRRNR
jgi:hypothetical protein